MSGIQLNKRDSLKAFFREKFMMVIVVLIFALVWILNHAYPLFNDDWIYSFNFHNKQSITGLRDILESQYWHYFEWGGRSVGHTIAQTLLWFGEGWSDWLNSMAFTAFVLVIYAIAHNRTGKSRPDVLILVFLLLWFTQRHYLGECVLWITGSANYLWCSLITLLFLSPVCSCYFRPASKKRPVVWSIAFFVAGIMAGWTNENMSVGLIFFMAVMFILLKYENKKIPVWLIWASAGLVIGCIILLVAPGNYVRYSSIAEQYTPFRLFELLRIIKEFGKFGVLVSVIYLIILGCFIRFSKPERKTQVLRLSLLFFCTAIVAWFVMLASPRFPPRAWFGITSFAIVAIALLYANISKERPVISKSNVAFLVASFYLFSVSYVLSLKETIRIRKILDEREQYIEEQREQGNRDITIRKGFECVSSPFIILPRLLDLPSNASDWSNWGYAKYNNIDSVRVIPLPEETK